MKLSAPFVWLVIAVGVAEATEFHTEHGLLGHRPIHARHGNHHRDLVDGHSRDRRANSKRCKPRTSSLASSSTPTSSSAKSTKAAAHKTSSSSTAKSTASTNNQVSSATKLNTASSGQCGASGATEKLTATTGPNGSEEWFNCGIGGGGWTPPTLTLDNVVTKDLAAAVAESNSPFKACEPYLGHFYDAQGKYGVPAIFFASIAMQESSCNPNTVGGGGEQGLMQISKDKCGGAPNGNCKDAAYNIDTGAGFFAGLIKQYGGNIIPAIGNYNGWFPKMTHAQATAAADSSCCPCQQNLDYITQTLNGWILGNDPTSGLRIGSYFNLDVCHRG